VLVQPEGVAVEEAAGAAVEEAAGAARKVLRAPR